MGAISALTAIGIAGSIYQGYEASRAARAQGRYEQTVHDQNADMLEMSAQDALARGDKDAGRVRRKAGQLKGTQRAAYAGQGVSVNSGTAAAIQDETQVMGELDALEVKNNAVREAWGYRTKAAQSREAGRFARKAGKKTAQSSLISGGLNALSFGMKGSQLLR